MAKCKRCNADIVYLTTDSGKHIPVNTSSLSEDDKMGILYKNKVRFDHKRHITHFSDCPFANEFRKKK